VGISVFLEKLVFFGYIVPNSITRVGQFGKIRKFLLEKTDLWHVVDEESPFIGVTLEMVTLFFKKDIPTNRKVWVKSRRNVEKRENYVSKQIFRRFNWFILYCDEIFENMINNSLFGFVDGIRGGDIPKKIVSTQKTNIHKFLYLYSGKSVKNTTLT